MNFINSIKENRQYLLAYDIIISVLSIVAVIIITIDLLTDPTVYDNTLFTYIDNIILLIFTIDYIVRLGFSKNKITFIKSNIIDLISIIPFNIVFQSFRLVRLIKLLKLIKLLRIIALLEKFRGKSRRFIKTNNLNYALYITCFAVLVGAFSFSLTEDKSFIDSLWWSFVTITTVGYGDLSPSTNSGRIIAAILMLVGIGFLSMLTGTISTFFLKRREPTLSIKNDMLSKIQERLNNFNELSGEDIDDIYNLLKALKKDS